MTREPGYRFSYAMHFSGPGQPVPDKPGWFAFPPELADYFFVCSTGTLNDSREHFATEDEAKARVKELNEADAIASLEVPHSHRERFERYRKLHTHFGWAWHDAEHRHHPLTRLPKEPGRYAVETGYNDGDSYWSHHETLEEVRAEIAHSDVAYRIVDLDTGQDVPFTRIVLVEIEA